MVQSVRNASSVQDLVQFAKEPVSGFVQPPVQIVVFFQQPQLGQSCCHGDRIPAQSSGLIHWTDRGDTGHDLLPAAISAYRHTAADDLAKGGEIRLNIKKLPRTAQSETETGDDFVENEQCAFLIA